MKKLISTILMSVFLFFFSAVNATAQSFVLDLDGATMSFLESDKTLVSGTDKAQGAVYKYSNLLSHNGRNIYGILTLVEVNNATINTFDDDSSVIDEVKGRLQPKLAAGSGGGYILYKFEFFEVGTDFSVFLYNYNLTGVDVDGSVSYKEYFEVGGYSSYTVDNTTGLTISTNSSTGRTKFLGIGSSLSGVTFENTAAFIANYTDPNNIITFVLGISEQNSERLFSAQFGISGGTFTTPNTTQNAVPVAVDDVGSDIYTSAGGTAVSNMLDNDIYNGNAVVPSEVTISEITPASNAGVVLNTSTGAVTVAPGTPIGTYTIVYKIQLVADANKYDQGTVTINVLADLANTWDGSSGDAWGTADNWSDNAVPTSSDDAVIPSGQNVIISPTTSASCANLSILGDGTLTIQSEGVNNTSGSLIVSGTSSGNITYERWVSGDRWHLIGSPLVGQDIGDLLQEPDNDIKTTASGYSMKDYVESTNYWSADYTSATPGDCTMGQGYATKRNTSGFITYTGTVTTDTITRPLSRDYYGWVLVSNPYTSAIGVTASAASSNRCLSTSNCDLMDENFAALYLWDEQDGYNGTRFDYRTISNAGGGLSQHYVQVGQGFLVRSKSNSGTFQFTTSMQVHQPSAAFKSTAQIWPTIRLNVQSEDMSSYTEVCYHEDMTRGLDISYDAGMLKGNPNFALYSRLIEDNGVDFAMQCLPKDYDNLVIPIRIDAANGTALTFTAETLNLPVDYNLYIEDRKNDIFTLLLNESDYYSTVLNQEDIGMSRFYLHTKSSLLAIDEDPINDTYKIIANPQENTILIKGRVEETTLLSIWDLMGKKIQTTKLNQSDINRVLFVANSGVYVVKVQGKTMQMSQKIHWVK